MSLQYLTNNILKSRNKRRVIIADMCFPKEIESVHVYILQLSKRQV